MDDDERFWLARVDEKSVKVPYQAGKGTLKVKWFELTKPNSKVYRETQLQDEIAVSSIFHAKFDQFWQPHGKNKWVLLDDIQKFDL